MIRFISRTASRRPTNTARLIIACPIFSSRIASIGGRLDIHTLDQVEATALGVNDIGRVRFEAQDPLPLAPYAYNRVAGAMIVVDPASHRTSGAVLVEQVR